MPITLEEVKKIAHLARLDFEEEELKNFTEELSKILDYFQQLQEIETSYVEPIFHPFKKKTPLREDKVRSFDNIEGILKNTSELRDTFMVVPKVIKGN